MKTDSKRKMILGVQLVGCCFAICIIYGGFIAVKRLMKENMVSTKTAKEQAEVAAIVHIEPTPVEAPVVEEAVEKARYYLSHEEKRLQIQQNSYAIIKEKFSYPERIATMFQTAGL